MGPRRLLCLLLGALLLTLGVPAGASAASYTWDQPSDFQYTGPGHNPGGDRYVPGGASWRYDESQPCPMLLFVCSSPASFDPSNPVALNTFGTISGTLTGWSDASDTAGYIGLDSASPSTLQMRAPTDRVEALGWTNPLGHPGSFTISGSVAAGGSGGTCFTWALVQGTTTLSSGSGPGAVSASPSPTTVPAGGSIYLTLARSGAVSSSCDIAEVTLHITESESTPVTLTQPVSGAVFANSQPTFAGTASTAYAASKVTVNVYSGAAPSGSPVQALPATPGADGSFSVAPNPGLGAGQYTAQAVQTVGDQAVTSSPTTFAVTTATQGAGPASITLNSPGTAPLSDNTPTLTGTSNGNTTSVSLAVWAGTTTSAAPVRYLTGSRNTTTGLFSVTITPALPDGTYTAIAGQSGSEPGLSNTVTFTVKAGAPTLTITVPAPGGNIADAQPTFSGTAGTAPGDSGSLTLILHSGNSAAGPSVGSDRITAANGSWSFQWPNRLANGIYTLVAIQTDNAGHTVTVATTFVIVPAPSVIGSRVTLSGSTASLSVSCTAKTACAGTVLALTTRALRPRAGGPGGPVRVIFAFVRIAAGKSTTVRQKLPSYVVSALKHSHGLKVKVTVTMLPLGRASATRSLST